MFEWDLNVQLKVGFPTFSKLVETIHDYVWEGDEDDE